MAARIAIAPIKARNRIRLSPAAYDLPRRLRSGASPTTMTPGSRNSVFMPLVAARQDFGKRPFAGRSSQSPEPFDRLNDLRARLGLGAALRLVASRFGLRLGDLA